MIVFQVRSGLPEALHHLRVRQIPWVALAPSLRGRWGPFSARHHLKLSRVQLKPSALPPAHSSYQQSQKHCLSALLKPFLDAVFVLGFLP